MTRLIVAVLVALTLTPSPARAQAFEVTGLVSYTPSSDLDQRAPELESLAIRSGFTWGIQFGRTLTPHWSAEVSWTLQHSGLELGTTAGSADLFTLTIGQVQGNAVYSFGESGATLRPFVFAGLGASFFAADDLESETKLSFGVGGGAKYFFSDTFGLRGHFRYRPTVLDDTDARPFCDPFGFCQSVLQQVEIAAGAIVRF